MNKKNLSVVMAGAMLATSVAPVLADSTTVNNSNRGLLIKEFRELINSKTFADTTGNANVTKDEEGNTVATRNYANKSVYYVENDREIKFSSTIERASFANNDLYEDAVIKKIEEVSKIYGVTFDHPDKVQNDNKKIDGINVNLNVTGGNVEQKKSVFTITIDANTKLDTDAKIEEAIQNAEKGTKFTAWDKGHVEKDGKYYAYALEDVETPATFTENELKKLGEAWSKDGYVDYDKDGDKKIGGGEGSLDSNVKIKDAFPAVADMKYNETDKTLTVSIRKAENDSANFTKTYKVGDAKVDFTKAINEKGELLTGTLPTDDFSEINQENPFDIYTLALSEGAMDKYTVTNPGNTATVVEKGSDLPEKEVKTVEITDVDYDYTTTLPELYDGLFLTEDGQKLLDTMKEYDSNGWTVSGETKADINDEMNGIYSLLITFEKTVNGKTTKQTVKITSKDKTQLGIFADGIDVEKTMPGTGRKVRRFPVQVLAGSNRYETAVKVAKENADITTVAENGNIVLVNGNSLVDGLAAAPLAASVWNKDMPAGTYPGGEEGYVAPILLTDANGLPKVTKDYMKEVVAHQRVGALDEVTVYLVGGEAVISKAVENDLKEIGVRVVRAGGADREATSLAVAEMIEKDTKKEVDDAFVVGAHGEADAMSIASVAARENTPIIVESVHGIKEETINYLKGYKGSKAKVTTIIGGETAVSKETEEMLKDAKLSVDRVAGSNRQATNAAVINTYYTNGSVDQFVVSKDGINNKSELIDALTATSLAVKHNAPIVLGTKKVTTGDAGQINAMELKAKESGVYVYQVGYGVARDVIQTIASRIGLAK